ncbi:MAG TPA: DUF58 domain-containing protein [Dehalococcoidia bacterium]|nr:DUF58 domain-containing protein [Dehalococcoidia bacterium]
MPAGAVPPIPPDMLARVRRLEIQARRLVVSAFLGEYHSVFRGRGIEFSEVRPYDHGDDVRAIDWNVTARMGAPYVKKYVEERELTVLLVVDISASLQVTTTRMSKRQLAAEVAATLAFAAVANNDRVGLITFSDRVERFVPPGKGRMHVLRLLRELLYEEPAGRGTDIAAALSYVMRVARRRAIVFALSDFFAPGFERSLRAAAARHDLLAITLGDPCETELPDVGLLEVADAEAGTRAFVDTSDARARAAYAAHAADRLTARSRSFAAAGVDEIALTTGASYVEPLHRAFRARERRR